MKGGVRVALVAGIVGACGLARADGAQRFEGTLFSFSYPASAATAPGADPSADVAISVTLAGGIRASVIGATKKVPEVDVENEATAWHGARIKNRAAWGMKAGGGPPRDVVRVGERKWLRWRDRIGSMLGAQEQSMTCGGVSGHLVCAIVTAPVDERERADALAAQILTSLQIKKR
ncbi:MAG TPA: hypothetical protein VGL86_25930 [Polyangia bacterium]|jgi:hypothetical protein